MLLIGVRIFGSLFSFVDGFAYIVRFNTAMPFFAQ